MADTKAPNTTEKPKKQGLFKYLDNALGEDGIRTDIKITLTNDTALKIVAVAVISTALSTVTYYILRSFFVPKGNASSGQAQFNQQIAKSS